VFTHDATKNLSPCGQLTRRVALAAVAMLIACTPNDEPVTPAKGQAAAHKDASDQPEGEHEMKGKHGEHGKHGHVSPHADHKAHDHHKHHRFENAEEWALQFDSPERAAWQKPDELVKSLKLPANAVIADIGAGTGYFAERFARAAPEGHVYAQDVEADMVRYLGERATKAGLTNLSAVQGTADDAGLTVAVDLAFVCDVYHHIANPSEFFKKLRAKLRPGARVVIVDFSPDAPDDAPGPPPAMRVAPKQVIEQFAAAGYKVTRQDSELLPYQYVLEFTPS
jgi:ubiquinone/menaquinone biosynthesis C-methylase UbiE